MTITNDIDTALIEADEQTALAQAEQQLQELLAADPNILDMVGGENLEEGDTGQAPRLKLCQPTTTDTTAQMGEFYNTLTGEVFSAVEVIPLQPLSATRCEYFRPYKKGEPPYCASDDGKMPRESTDRRPLQNPKPGPCASCPSAQWDNENNKPSLCTRQRNFMVMIRQSGEIAQFTMQKSGTKTAKHFTSLMISAGIRKSVIFTSKYVEDDSGKYYVPLATAGGRLPADELIRTIEVRKEVQRLVNLGAIKVASEDEIDYGNGGNGGDGSVSDSSPSPDFSNEEEFPF
jgi:hypothetical protein